MLKNDIISAEFEQLRQKHGEAAFQANKKKLIDFVKKGKLNLTYSVKYYGVNEDQIGILSRRVPFEEMMLRAKERSVPHFLDNKLPPISQKVSMPQQEFVEVEVTDDESD